MKFQKHCPGCFQSKGGLAICPYCGYDESAGRSPLFLQHGMVLGDQYRVGKVLGRPGGFGITYLGWDINLQQRVAIKEYLPRDLATRAPDFQEVVAQTPEDRRAFEFGKEQFLREARIVARLDHPNIVRVRNFFNANGTAYMVMDYYEGMSLGDYLSGVRQVIEPEVAVPLIRPILDGLQYVHERGVVHRDLKPHNIYLAAIGRPILLDFGAARQAAGDRVQSMSVVLTEGYAPLEQYQRRTSQGPWTDVYGVGATLFRMLTGAAPPIPLDRLGKDPLDDPEFFQRVPEILVAPLRQSLSVRPSERYQGAQEMRDALDIYRPSLPESSTKASGGQSEEDAPSRLGAADSEQDTGSAAPAALINPEISESRRYAPPSEAPITVPRPEIVPEASALVVAAEAVDQPAPIIEPAQPAAIGLDAEQEAPTSRPLNLALASTLERLSNLTPVPSVSVISETRAPTASPAQGEPSPANVANLATVEKVTLPTPTISMGNHGEASPQNHDRIAPEVAQILLDDPPPFVRAKPNLPTLPLPALSDKPEAPSNTDKLLLWQLLVAALLMLGLVYWGWQAWEKHMAGEAANKVVVPPPSFVTSTAGSVSAANPPVVSSESTAVPPNMIGIPSGEILLGKSDGLSTDTTLPQELVKVRAFKVSANEISLEEFTEFVNQTRYVNPRWVNYPCETAGVPSPEWDNPGYSQTDDFPVVCVNWEDAQAYTAWLSRLTGQSFRLPTEAEWEYVTRAGSDTLYWWGKDYNPGYAECQGCSPKIPSRPAPVRSFPANAFGVYDTASNVREWTCSMFAKYGSGSAGQCGTPIEESLVSVRGGSWQDGREALRSNQRRGFEPYRRNTWTGFRVVQELSESSTIEAPPEVDANAEPAPSLQ
jgi:formylglycine-generating enzyme required for sulfatase activity/serine/threonine protein kinase